MYGFQFHELRRVQGSQSCRPSDETHGYRPSKLNGSEWFMSDGKKFSAGAEKLSRGAGY